MGNLVGGFFIGWWEFGEWFWPFKGGGWVFWKGEYWVNFHLVVDFADSHEGMHQQGRQQPPPTLLNCNIHFSTYLLLLFGHASKCLAYLTLVLAEWYKRLSKDFCKIFPLWNFWFETTVLLINNNWHLLL